MMKQAFFIIILVSISAFSEPVVLSGDMLPEMLGEPVQSLRVLDSDENAIPFQVDEVTSEGEYVLFEGDKPNSASGNGVLDKQDEIVFLLEDGDTAVSRFDEKSEGVVVRMGEGKSQRAVYVRSDGSIPLSDVSYIKYDDSKQHITTPFYYATFGRNRFHFTDAGVKDTRTGKFIHLTNELRVEILLKALWGLVPIRYSEENVVCLVQRYKCGPVRLIRRGDFHLNLGLGVKGSKASVNQICYPQMVKVPVRLHVPFRFRTLFSEAFLEMTPVLRETGSSFSFSVPSEDMRVPLSQNAADTLYPFIPDGKFFTVHENGAGYGWLLQTSMDASFIDGSGFVLRKPSKRDGYAECGYRLTVNDVPKGYYSITNWVVFPNGSYSDLLRNGRSLKSPVIISVDDRTFSSRLTSRLPHKRGK
ncbi:MAG: hypothetical protein ACLFVQ_09650 [Chitinispirillaceae bacterium]